MTSAPKPIELLLVDDHALFRRGLTALLSQDGRFKVVGQASDVGEAVRELMRHTPDMVLLDNNMPGVRGVDGIAALKDIAPDVRILMLTVSEDEDDLAAALRAGAEGYLLKTAETEYLCEAIVKVIAGESVVSAEMMTKLVSAFRSTYTISDSLSVTNTSPTQLEANLTVRDAAMLSAREREVLNLLAKGESNKLIARALDIAETTVKIHVQHILRKLQLKSRVQAAVYAVSLQTTDLEPRA